MTDFSTQDQEEVLDWTPHLKLFIDKDGAWFQNGAQIVHPEIYLLFNQILEKDLDGGYQVRLGGEVCRVQVEDAPFVVQRVEEDERDRLYIELNDKTRELFDPERFWIGEKNVPYIKVKNGSFHARFSRPAYYQLAEHIVADEREESFFFMFHGNRVPVKRSAKC
jgi:hypothetical protein